MNDKDGSIKEKVEREMSSCISLTIGKIFKYIYCSLLRNCGPSILAICRPCPLKPSPARKLSKLTLPLCSLDSPAH